MRAEDGSTARSGVHVGEWSLRYHVHRGQIVCVFFLEIDRAVDFVLLTGNRAVDHLDIIIIHTMYNGERGGGAALVCGSFWAVGRCASPLGGSPELPPRSFFCGRRSHHSQLAAVAVLKATLPARAVAFALAGGEGGALVDVQA
jgi:hypothetical protein